MRSIKQLPRHLHVFDSNNVINLHFFCMDLAVDYLFWKYAVDMEELLNGFVVFYDRMNRKFQIHSLVYFKFIFSLFDCLGKYAMTKEEIEKEVRVERLLQKMLTCLNALFALLLTVVVFLLPWLYKESLWKIYVESIHVLYSYWTGGIRLDAPLRAHILGCISLLLLHWHAMAHAASRLTVAFNVVAFFGFFSCRTLLRLR